MVDFPIRTDSYGTGNTLDLLLTTHPALVSGTKPLAGISDHDIVQAKFSTKTSLGQKPSRKISLWKNVDTDKLKSSAIHLRSAYFDRAPGSKSVN